MKTILLFLFSLPLMGQVAITLGASGPTSLTWNGGASILDASTGPIVSTVSYIDGGGMRTTGGTGSSGASHVGNCINNTYLTSGTPWGTVSVCYTANGNTLFIAITTTSLLITQTIDRMNLFPIGINAPATLIGAPASQFNLNAPTSVLTDDGTEAIALVNDDPNFQILTVGFRTLAAGGRRFWVLAGIDSDHTLSNSFPPVNRPIGPLGTDTYNISLRFGSTSTGNFTLSSDIFKAFEVKFPSTLIPLLTSNGPICRLSTTSRLNPTVATNPRGWNITGNPNDINITTGPGITAFQNTLLGWADNAIVVMNDIGCKQGIFWDMDGQQTALAYVGDPSQIETNAPEIVGVLDTVINKFITAGITIGFTFRPQAYSQQFSVVNITGTTVDWVSGPQFDTGWVSNTANDPSSLLSNSIWLDSTRLSYNIAAVASTTQMTLVASAGTTTNTNLMYSQMLNQSSNFLTESLISDKLNYTTTRWGVNNVKFIYIDTTTDGVNPVSDNTTSLAASVFENLKASFPLVTFAPEEFSTQNYAYSIPFQNASPPFGPGPGAAATYYKKAFNLVDVTDTAATFNVPQLLTALEAGNVLLVDGWYSHLATTVVKALYAQVNGIISSSGAKRAKVNGGVVQ